MSLPSVKPVAPPVNAAVTNGANAKVNIPAVLPVHTGSMFDPDKINRYLSAMDLITHAFANIFGIVTHVTQTDPKTNAAVSIPRAVGDIAAEVATAAAGASATVFAGGAANTSGKVAEVAATVSGLSDTVAALVGSVTDAVNAVNAHTDILTQQGAALNAITSNINGVAAAGGEGA